MKTPFSRDCLENSFYFLFAAGLFCCAPQSAHAWTPLGATWPNLPVPYEVNGGSSQEMGSQTSVDVIRASYEAWITPSCSAFRVQYRGTTSNAWRSGDGLNTHQWIYNSNQRPAELGGRETIGVTLSLYRGSSLIDGDILYNGIDHRWTTNATQFGQVDAQSIITHEIGHQLGLGHSSTNGATMFPSYAGGTGPRSLSQDDLEGVCALYPSSGGVECTRAADCGGGLDCVQGSCVQVSGGEGQIGDRCDTSDCVDGLVCVANQNNSTFCTRICNDGQCPGGWDCYRVGTSQGEINLCLPSEVETGDASFGDSCNSGQECVSGLCVSDGSQAFCSQACTQDGDCPTQSACYGLDNGGGACVPGGGESGAGGFGSACQSSTDCASEICLDDGGSIYCSEVCQADRDCQTGAACFNAGDINVCAWAEDEAEGGSTPSAPQALYGDPCLASAECVDNLCLSDGQGQFCSRYCSVSSDCPNNDMCVSIGGGQGACLPASTAGGSTGGEEIGGSASGSGGQQGPVNPENTGGVEVDIGVSDTNSRGPTCQASPLPQPTFIFLCLFTISLLILRERQA